MVYGMHTHKNTYSETWSLVSLPSSTETLMLPFTCSAANSAPAGTELHHKLQCAHNMPNTHKEKQSYVKHQGQGVSKRAHSC